jgi:hypothetical protein
MKKGCGAINPDCSGIACCCDHSRGTAAEESPSDKVSPSDAATDSTRIEAIQLALRELGYVEGQNIAFECRYTEGKRGRESAACGRAGVSRLTSSL